MEFNDLGTFFFGGRFKHGFLYRNTGNVMSYKVLDLQQNGGKCMFNQNKSLSHLKTQHF